MKHIIIGIGAAAVSAARRIVKEKPDDTVIMISKDDKVHSRCMLHNVISGERDEDSINFINDDLLESPNIQWIKNKTITRLDSGQKIVYAGDEEVARGDTILIATGADSIIPPIGELAKAKNAFGLRHLSDARAIMESAKKAKKIAVIGAGLVGLDAVYGILESPDGEEKDISVIEMAGSILAINLDAHAADTYQRLFEDKGVKFYLGKKVINTRSRGENITALELDDGLVVHCDMVIVAVGVRPALAFLAESGVELTERRAVKVDEYLSTNIPGIYAAGDAAGLSGIWPNAQKQGEIAGYNMTGTKWIYDDLFAFKNTINFFNLPSLSMGFLNAKEGDRVLIREDKKSYQKLILRDGIPVGVILQGEIGGSGFWQYLIKNTIRIDNLGGSEKNPWSVWKVSYADFYGMEENGEYKWVIKSMPKVR